MQLPQEDRLRFINFTKDLSERLSLYNIISTYNK